jgi:hypothetical protein
MVSIGEVVEVVGDVRHLAVISVAVFEVVVEKV